MSHSYVENNIHLVFSTKERENLITPDIESRLHAYLGGIGRNRKSPVILVNGVADHVHLLVRLHPTVALAALVKEFKSYSTGWAKKQGHSRFAWQAGYGAFSVSHSMMGNVHKYIASQKEHHKTQTLEQEIGDLIASRNLTWSFLENEVDHRKQVHETAIPLMGD